MIRIFCTKKLQRFLGNIVEDTLPANSLERSVNNWNAHLFFISKRKCLIFVNNLTGYSFFITDILKKDVKDLRNLFLQKLHKQLWHDRVLRDYTYFQSLFGNQEIRFFRTNNDKKVTGSMNDLIIRFKLHKERKYPHLELSEMDEVYEGGLFNEVYLSKPGDPAHKLNIPRENMIKALNKRIQYS